MQEENKNKFGSLLRTMRESAGKSMGEVARHLGLTVPFISDVERGNRGPLPPEKIRLVAAFLGIDSTELLRAAAESRGVVQLAATTTSRLEAGAALMRGWENLSEEDLRDLTNYMNEKVERKK